MPRTTTDPDTDPAIRSERLRAIATEAASALCAYLPGEWHPVESGHYQAAIGAGDGRELTLTATTGCYDEDRLIVITRFDGDVNRFADGHLEMDMTLASGASTIARQIAQHLLPAMDTKLARAQAAKAAAEERWGRVRTALARIEQVLPATAPVGVGSFSRACEGPDGFRGQFTIAADGFAGSLTLRAAPVDLLVALARFLVDEDASPVRRA